jgi:hypothetical protein
VRLRTLPDKKGSATIFATRVFCSPRAAQNQARNLVRCLLFDVASYVRVDVGRDRDRAVSEVTHWTQVVATPIRGVPVALAAMNATDALLTVQLPGSSQKLFVTHDGGRSWRSFLPPG